MTNEFRTILHTEGKGYSARCRIQPQSLAIVYNGLLELHRQDPKNGLPPAACGRLIAASVNLLAQAMLDAGLAKHPTRAEAVQLVSQLMESASRLRTEGINLKNFEGPVPSEFTPVEK